MLGTIAAVGGGLFVLASLVVGGRVALLSFKTKGLPEFLLGTGLFLMGGLGYPMMQIAQRATQLPDDQRAALMIAQMTFMVAGMSGVAWFTRRVFRPKAAWAGALLLGIAAAYSGLAIAQVMGPGLMAFLENPEVAVMFMVPGLNEVLRLNGRARLTTDETLLAKMVANGKTPLAALVIDIRYVYFHCGKAIIRADLWNPEAQIDRKDFPSMGQINQDWYGVDGKEVDKKLADDYVNTLY